MIEGNYIGTDFTGKLNQNNGYLRRAARNGGILLQGSPGTMIGGSAPGAGNLTYLQSGAGNPQSTIPRHNHPRQLLGRGCHQGTNTLNFSGGYGVYGQYSIGTVIKSNVFGGLYTLGIFSESYSNIIQGNFMGVDVTGHPPAPARKRN